MRGGRCRGKLSEVAVVAGSASRCSCGCAVAAADDSSSGSSSAGSCGAEQMRPKKRRRRGRSARRARQGCGPVIDAERRGPTKAASATSPHQPDEPQPEEDGTKTTDVVKVDSGRRPRAAHAEVSRPATPAEFGARHRRTDSHRPSGRVQPSAGGATSVVVDQGQIGVGAGPATITTAPPSFLDRLIVRTLQALRRNAGGLFGGDVSGLTGTAPPRFVGRDLTITKGEYNGWTVWEFAPKTPSGEYVLALHGGGFVAEANIINWADYASMARDTGATVRVPIYPLAPPIGTGTVSTLIPPMADYLSMLVDEHGVDNVSLYGDSAGGTFAMLTAQELIRRCRADGQCILSDVEPSRMVLISPILDLTFTGPEIDAIDDPIIPRPQPGAQGPDITGGLDVNDPRVNPISGDLTGLPPTAVYVGTIERPNPGDLAFRDKLLAQDPNADFTVIIGDGQMHDWALGGIFVNSQAPIWRPTIYRQLGLLPDCG